MALEIHAAVLPFDRPIMRRRLLSISILVCIALASTSIFAAETRTTVFEIRGMYCSGCAEGIQSMVKRMDGVIKVEASYEERQAIVDYDPAKISAEKIIAAIEKIGYKAKIRK